MEIRKKHPGYGIHLSHDFLQYPAGTGSRLPPLDESVMMPTDGWERSMVVMRMKMIAWAVAIILVIVWVIPVAYANFLTAIVGDEFANTEEIGFTGMHPWEGKPDFRVLSYSKNVASNKVIK